METMTSGSGNNASTAMLPWYAVRTKANFEAVVASSLKAKGYECFLPTYITDRQWSDRVMRINMPLFPGYMFCRIDLRKKLTVISTPGVVSLVSYGNKPATIDEGEICFVQTIVESGLPVAECGFLNDGVRVRVREGALEGLEGIVVKHKSDYRIIVSVTMLQRSVAVEIDRSLLALIEPLSENRRALETMLIGENLSRPRQPAQARANERQLL